jgi:hypothetical protein
LEKLSGFVNDATAAQAIPGRITNDRGKAIILAVRGELSNPRAPSGLGNKDYCISAEVLVFSEKLFRNKMVATDHQPDAQIL